MVTAWTPHTFRDGAFIGGLVARQRRCFLVGAVGGRFATTRLGTPGNARGRSDVPGPPYSLTAGVRQGNHFDGEKILGPPNRFRCVLVRLES
jgi:hypothetical protein